jgi:hypothetical protein
MNLSQEGLTVVETLVEEKLVIGLKLSTTEFRPVTAYQVSEKGLQFLNSLPASLIQEVNNFVYAPHAPTVESELLHVVFSGEGFLIQTKSGYSRESTCTVVEDVSYVVSPFIPASLLSPYAKPVRSNAHRAHEASIGIANIQDKKFKEAIKLEHVCVLVGEWIPFGANGIGAAPLITPATRTSKDNWPSSSSAGTPLRTTKKVIHAPVVSSLSSPFFHLKSEFKAYPLSLAAFARCGQQSVLTRGLMRRVEDVTRSGDVWI